MNLQFWRRRGITPEDSAAVQRAASETRALQRKASRVSADLREHASNNHFAERIGRALEIN